MTDFKDILIKYMEELDCSSKELQIVPDFLLQRSAAIVPENEYLM